MKLKAKYQLSFRHSHASNSCGMYAEILQKQCKKRVGGGGGGCSCKQSQGEHNTGRQCGPPQHIKQCSLSCLIRIAIEAPEELSESVLNEIIDVWQRKSRRISV